MRIGILGAGAAGLSAAYFLRGSPHEVAIHEASADVGGLAGSFRWHGFDCDLAPHRLHCDDETILAELGQITPLRKIRRRSRIYIGGRWLADPLSPTGLLLHFPPRRAWTILRSYLTRPKLSDDSFASLARSRFGDALYEMFFRPYSEKLFGVPADQIAASWGRRKLRLGHPVRQWRRGSRLHFRQFYYPRSGGYGAICRGLANALGSRCAYDRGSSVSRKAEKELPARSRKSARRARRSSILSFRRCRSRCQPRYWERDQLAV